MSRFENGYALMVGVGNYQSAQINSVPVTVTDAEFFAGLLQNPDFAGYDPSHITLLTNEKASREGILAALENLTERVTAQSTVIIFLCGHGVELDKGTYCFAPCDTGVTVNGELDTGSVISQQELSEVLDKLKARKLLIIFNTCHSGSMAGNLEPTAGLAGNLGKPPSTEALLRLGEGEGRAVISACRSDQLSWFDQAAKTTLFTTYLLEGLKGTPEIANHKGYIGIFELYNYLYDKVSGGVAAISAGARQEPVITARNIVGPFPVALYQGGTNLGTLVLAEKELISLPKTSWRNLKSKRIKFDDFSRFSKVVSWLLECPSLRTPVARTRVIDRLPENIQYSIDYGVTNNAKSDIISIVQTCLNFPDGFYHLMEVLDFFDGNTYQFCDMEQNIASQFY
jgi:hypothetical protein